MESISTRLGPLALLWTLLLAPAACFEVSRLASFSDDGLGYEVIFAAILVLSIANYVHGKAQNKKVALNFFSEVMPTLYSNFAIIGDQAKLTVKPPPDAGDSPIEYLPCEDMMSPRRIDAMLEQDSSYYFRLFCTGRKHLSWAFVDVQTRRRQDMLTNLFYNIVIPERDKVSVELKIANSDVKACSYVLRSKKVKRAMEDFKDLSQLCRRFNLLKNRHLSIFCENEDVARCVYKEDILATLERNCFLVESLDLTDCLENKLTGGVFLRLTFYLFNQRRFLRMQKKYCPEPPGALPASSWEAYQELIDMVLRVGDQLTGLKVSRKNLDEMEAKRKVLASGKTKEELKQEKVETQQKLRDERLKKMTRKERERFLEKDKKRRKDKMMKKFKVVKSG